MKFVIYSLAISLVFTGFVFADQLTEKPLKDVKLDFTKVASDRLTYAIYTQSKNDAEKDLGDTLGEVIMSAMPEITVELKVDVKANEVVINQKFSMFGGYTEYSSICKKNLFLSPKTATLKTELKNRINEMKAVYENGRVTYEQDGQKREPIDFPKDTVIFIHLFRIIPQLPKDTGVIYTFENFNRLSSARALKAEEGKQFGIVYKGPQQIEIENQKLKIDRYDLVGDKYMCQLFINDKGQVNFVRTNNSLMTLLTTEQIAKIEQKQKKKENNAEANRQKMLTDIHELIWRGKVEDIKNLLDKNPQAINRKNKNGETPLHRAAALNKLEVVKLLLERGADITAIDNSGDTCLHEARDKKLVNYLADKEPDLMAVKSRMNRTPLLQMVSQNAVEGVDVLLSKITDPEELTKQMNEALLTAAYADKSNMVKYLIGKGADVNARDAKEYTPLIKCKNRKGKEVIELLCSAGAKINVKSKYGDIPLNRLASAGNVEAVKYLVENGADVKVKDNNGNTPLHVILYNVAEIAEILIAAGADVNAKNAVQDTPLHRFAAQGKIKAIELLLKNGADINAKQRFGKTPLDFAIEKNKQQVIDLLKKHGAKTSPRVN